MVQVVYELSDRSIAIRPLLSFVQALLRQCDHSIDVPLDLLELKSKLYPQPTRCPQSPDWERAQHCEVCR